MEVSMKHSTYFRPIAFINLVMAFCIRKLPRRRIPTPALVILVLLLLSLAYTQSHLGTQGVSVRQHGFNQQHPEFEENCLPELSTHGFKDKIFLSRRCITPVWLANIDRNVVGNVSDDPLIKSPTFVNLSECDRKTIESIACEPLKLEVPPPFPIDSYPEFLFGVATTHERLKASMGPWSHWLANAKARIVAVVTDREYTEHDVERTEMEHLMAEQGVDITLVSRHGDNADRARQQFLLLRDLTQQIKADTRWVGIVDDDTFFPSLWPIRQRLSRYDPAHPLYLGALSEDIGAVMEWGFMGFGGAGIFLSVPLLHELEPWLSTCMRDSNASQGDVLLRECIYQHTEARFTDVPGLHQQDFIGDVTGFYEAGLNPLSLHHWKSWHHVPVMKMARVGDICGDCFLQRWKFGRNTVLANGFSVNVYADEVLNDIQLEDTEGTWDFANDGTGRWDSSLGPLRSKIEGRHRKRFVLVDAEWVDSQTMRQIYAWRGTRRTERPEKIDDVSPELIQKSVSTLKSRVEARKARADADVAGQIEQRDSRSQGSNAGRLGDVVKIGLRSPQPRSGGDTRNIGDLQDRPGNRASKRDLGDGEMADEDWDEVLELLWKV
ncbi:Fc.00g003260.m01.CDS01 [Cosmosporella sp. VM-42]